MTIENNPSDQIQLEGKDQEAEKNAKTKKTMETTEKIMLQRNDLSHLSSSSTEENLDHYQISFPSSIDRIGIVVVVHHILNEDQRFNETVEEKKDEDEEEEEKEDEKKRREIERHWQRKKRMTLWKNRDNQKENQEMQLIDDIRFNAEPIITYGVLQGQQIDL